MPEILWTWVVACIAFLAGWVMFSLLHGPQCGDTKRRFSLSQRKLQWVKELHYRVSYRSSDVKCAGCGHPWPCPTIRVVDSPDD